jgi:hypothetical protein
LLPQESRVRQVLLAQWVSLARRASSHLPAPLARLVSKVPEERLQWVFPPSASSRHPAALVVLAF